MGKLRGSFFIIFSLFWGCTSSAKRGDLHTAAVWKQIAGMSLEEKIGQLFIVQLREPQTGTGYKRVTPRVRQIVEEYHPGGVILFGSNLSTVEGTVALTKELQELSPIPLFIGIDEEGGSVSRLYEAKEIEATVIPSAATIGATGSSEAAYRVGAIIGSELWALGVNLNFAPVADISTNPLNTVISKRAFSDDPYTVGLMASSFVEGLQERGVISVLKHFPGHGDTSEDTHYTMGYLSHSLKQLRSQEFIPFQMGVERGASAIMTAHITVPLVDEKPATLSSRFLTEIIRNEWNFEGVIITDSLAMSGITRYWSSEEAAIAAFLAGSDILLIPSDLEAAWRGLYRSVVTGQIAEERVDSSLFRILLLKRQFNLPHTPPGNPEEYVGSPSHKRVIADLFRG